MAESDKLLKELEEEIQEIYARAAEEMQEKCDRYLERFAAKDQMMLDRLTAGDITQSEYYKWRTGQMLTGNRYKTMVNDLATDMTNANKLARSMTFGYMPEVYALSANEQAYEIEKALKIDTSYTLYNRQTVERLISREPKVLPGVRPGSKTAQLLAERKDLRWNKQKINSELTQGILQGEPIPKIAKRMRNVTDMNQASSIRNARTMTTSAQSGGQLDSLYRARDLGINVKKGWMAALDNRTRHEHAILDGQVRELDEPFEVSGKKIMFPGDPNAAPELVYNCRCRIIGQYDHQQSIRDMPRDSKLGNMSYDEWKKGHQDAVRQKKLAEEPSLAKCTNFTELKDYVESVLQAKMTDEVKTLDFEGVKMALQGVESVIDQYPGVGKAFNLVGISYEGYMCSDGSGVFFHPDYFRQGKFDGDTDYAYLSGAHEAGHIIDMILCIKEYGNRWDARYAWAHSEIARKIVSRAIKEVKTEHPEWASMSAQLIRSDLSNYAASNTAENLAEAVGHYASWQRLTSAGQTVRGLSYMEWVLRNPGGQLAEKIVNILKKELTK